MTASTNTQPSLLVRIRDERDDVSWSQFVDIYSPLVYGFLRKHGLQDSDAADLTQEVMAAVMTACKSFEYDQQKGSFRGWLFTVVRNQLRNFRRRKQQHLRGTGDTAAHQFLMEQPVPDEAADWGREYERHLFQRAAQQVRVHFQKTTWQAFWCTTVDGQPPKEVAESLGLTIAAIYEAKRRVIRQIKEQIDHLQGEST